ncbi:MAG: hypothetical protein ACLU3R_05200 [Acutalibacteraceae bacterium]
METKIFTVGACRSSSSRRPFGHVTTANEVAVCDEIGWYSAYCALMRYFCILSGRVFI